MLELWHLFLYQPLLQSLILLTKILGSFGLAILALTVATRSLLIPLTFPSLKSAKKIQDLKPHLDRLKEKYGHDKRRHQEETMKLYKEHGVNPLSGCLPQILQILILIALYQVFMEFIKKGNIDGTPVNMIFLWLNLSKPDKFYILPVLAGLTQLVLSLMMSPSSGHKMAHPKNEPEEKKEKEEDMGKVMQQQMTLMMPLMTGFIALSFPSGLALYWVATTVFSIVQQYFISGLGGLGKYLKMIK